MQDLLGTIHRLRPCLKLVTVLMQDLTVLIPLWHSDTSFWAEIESLIVDGLMLPALPDSVVHVGPAGVNEVLLGLDVGEAFGLVVVAGVPVEGPCLPAGNVLHQHVLLVPVLPQLLQESGQQQVALINRHSHRAQSQGGSKYVFVFKIVLTRYKKYRSIVILANVWYRYVVISQYFDMFGIERPAYCSIPSIISISLILWVHSMTEVYLSKMKIAY